MDFGSAQIFAQDGASGPTDCTSKHAKLQCRLLYKRVSCYSTTHTRSRLSVRVCHKSKRVLVRPLCGACTSPRKHENPVPSAAVAKHWSETDAITACCKLRPQRETQTEDKSILRKDEIPPRHPCSHERTTVKARHTAERNQTLRFAHRVSLKT